MGWGPLAEISRLFHPFTTVLLSCYYHMFLAHKYKIRDKLKTAPIKCTWGRGQASLLREEHHCIITNSLGI